MAKGQSITEEARTFGKGEFAARLSGDPLTHIQEQVQKNIHKVTRALKQEMVDMMKNRNERDGAEGTSYTKEYAAKKNRMVDGRSYSQNEEYDYYWSGQLMSALEGRGRAKPSQGTMDVWVGFRRNNRRPIQKTPGSNPRRRRTISNKRLAEILTNGLGEVDKPARAPFAIHREEHPRLIRKTALALMNNEYD